MVWGGRDLKDDIVPPTLPGTGMPLTRPGCSGPIQPGLTHLWESFEKKHHLFPKQESVTFHLRRGSRTSWIRSDVKWMSRSSQINFTLKLFPKFWHEAEAHWRTETTKCSIATGHCKTAVYLVISLLEKKKNPQSFNQRSQIKLFPTNCFYLSNPTLH